ncbi:hypothetical protein C7405_10138 [Paraburkholderia caballeronis]|nr:hypothetical protein C7405_10138 [Paraburkholderia caballeronis]
MPIVPMKVVAEKLAYTLYQPYVFFPHLGVGGGDEQPSFLDGFASIVVTPKGQITLVTSVHHVSML